MSQSIASRSATERLLALMVRYWACNMTVVHDKGQSWPGFGYNEEEQGTLRAIARKVGSFEFFVWIALVALFFIVAIAGIMATSYYVALALGVDPKPSTPESVLYVAMCCELVVCMSVGFPLPMLMASWLVGRWCVTTDADLPDRTTAMHFFAKGVFQIPLLRVIVSLVGLAMWLFVPGDSKFWSLSKVVLPLLSPAIAVLTAAYYFSARLRGRARAASSAPEAVAETSQKSG